MNNKDLNIADMSTDELRTYEAARKKAYRASRKAAVEAGGASATESTARDLLADLAIMILATNAPGSDVIMSGLDRYYVGKEGWPISIRAKCRTGKFKPKLIGKS